LPPADRHGGFARQRRAARLARQRAGGQRVRAMAPNAKREQLHEAGVSIWLDTLSRELLSSGEFRTLISDSNITGATSNPTIFAKAITGSDLYDEQLRALAESGQRNLQELYFAVALDDVRAAA